MQFYSSTDNLLNNISNNTYNLDKGDFPSLVGLVFRSNGSVLQRRSEEEFSAVKTYVYEDTFIPIQEMCDILAVLVSAGEHVVDLTTTAGKFEDMMTNIAVKYINESGTSLAWMKIKKFECNYTITASGTLPATTYAVYKLIVDIYAQD
jgi:hypothetical protein